MKAVIVAGGVGERLKPLTNNIPKPMVDINGKPILLHIINLFKKYNITDFIIALCYLPNIITKFFGDGRNFGVNITYMYEDPQKPLGTAGAITLAKKFVEGTFIVTYADILRELDVRDMINFHKRNKAFATLNVYKRESKNAKSRILIDSKNRIIKFIERPSKNELSKDHIWANGSFYILKPEIFDWIPDGRKTDFGTDIFPKLLALRKSLYAYPTAGYFIDIGDYKKLRIARRTFQ